MGKGLKEHLIAAIRSRGPISVAEYMRLCSSSPTAGYYAQGARPVFGRQGDFVTSPEMLSAFGDVLGLWMADVASQRPAVGPTRHLVEYGPGTGALMDDILSMAARFPLLFPPRATAVHLVESSPALAAAQAHRLRSGPPPSSVADSAQQQQEVEEQQQQQEPLVDRRGYATQWHMGNAAIDLSKLAPGPLFVIAHEFLDALPVHHMEYTSGGWREHLVDVDDVENAAAPFRFILAPGRTPASEAWERMLTKLTHSTSASLSSPARAGADEEEANFILHGRSRRLRRRAAPDSAPAVSVVGQEDAAGLELTMERLATAPRVGDQIEVSPDAENVVVHIADQVARRGGAALFIDYGQDAAYRNSLQGIRGHAFVHPLAEPGRTDLSAFVNFRAIRDAVNTRLHGAACVWGPVEQGPFLERLGIRARLARWASGRSDEEIAPVAEAYYRLCDPAEMGAKFKVLAITSPGLRPDGFADQSAPK